MNAPTLPSRVDIVEVGLRDGIQAEPVYVQTDEKIAIANALIAAGVKHFEISSFVSPRAVPQLADAAEVVAAVRQEGVTLSALVPNVKGAERAVEAGVDAMVVFMSASESHNLKNVNRTREASMAGFVEVCRIAESAGIPVHGAIATAFGCPFEGIVPVETIADIASQYADLGMHTVTLGDTTGMATPPLVTERCRAILAARPDVEIALHFHNTRGVGLVCVYAGLIEGITRYEASMGGLGGCPFAPNATGNISTEDLVYMLDEMGIESGVDLAAMIEIAKRAEKAVEHGLPGQVMKAGPRLRTYGMDSVRTAAG